MEDLQYCDTTRSNVGVSALLTKETGRDTSTHFGGHVIKIGSILLIAKLQCAQVRLKIAKSSEYCGQSL